MSSSGKRQDKKRKSDQVVVEGEETRHQNRKSLKQTSNGNNSRSDLLRQLRERMQRLTAENPENSWVFECSDPSLSAEQLVGFRKAMYDKVGVVVVLNAVKNEEIRAIRPVVGACMIDMYAEQNREEPWDEELRAALLSGDLYAVNAFRNFRHGFGNASFAYLYKQFVAEENATKAEIVIDESASNRCETVRFAHLPVHHHVLMSIMCTGAPRRTAILLALSATPEKTMISWDSVKVAGGPCAGALYKTMTKQERTTEHIDEYGARHGERTERVQAIINDDQDETKLCFVPFTHDPEVRSLIVRVLERPDFFKQHGFKRLAKGNKDSKACELIDVLSEFAVAPPPLSMVAWKSGVVHFEAITKRPAGNSALWRFSTRDMKGHRSDRRLRFVVGTHTPTLPPVALKRLAVIAKRGAVPEYNRNANRDCAPSVYENIMNGKSTQFLKPRVPFEREKTLLATAVDDNSEALERDWNGLSPLEKHLYGVSQPFETLGFSDRDIKLFCVAPQRK